MDYDDNGFIEAKERERERLKNVKEYQRKFFLKKYKKQRRQQEWKSLKKCWKN